MAWYYYTLYNHDRGTTVHKHVPTLSVKLCILPALSTHSLRSGNHGKLLEWMAINYQDEMKKKIGGVSLVCSFFQKKNKNCSQDVCFCLFQENVGGRERESKKNAGYLSLPPCGRSIVFVVYIVYWVCSRRSA